MQKKSERILELLQGGDTLKQARLKAIRITNEIQGFGNMMASPPSSSSPSSSRTSQSSSLASYSTTTSTWNDIEDGLSKFDLSKKSGIIEHYSKGGRGEEKASANLNAKKNFGESHIWDSCTRIFEEKGSLINCEEEEEQEMDEDNDNDDNKDYERPHHFLSGARSRLVCVSPLGRNNSAKFEFKSLSDVHKVKEKKMERQFSLQI